MSRLHSGPARIEALASVPKYQNQFTVRYRRMLVVYGIGTWSLVGSVLCFGWKMAKPSGIEVQQKDGSTCGVPSELSEPPKGFYVETIVTYKEDFVPITEKILNNWKSWTGGLGAEP
nr:small integral membrane protein 26-like [Macaca fascicularis]